MIFLQRFTVLNLLAANLRICNHIMIISWVFFFSCGSTAQFWALAASMKRSVSFRLLDLGQSAGLLGQVISSSQGLCVSAPSDCVMMEKLVEWTILAGETEVLGENLPWHHLPDPGANPGHHGGKPVTNCFSYGAAHLECYITLSLTFSDISTSSSHIQTTDGISSIFSNTKAFSQMNF
jgi:hypothetical protein